jgi:hypothetical protein
VSNATGATREKTEGAKQALMVRSSVLSGVWLRVGRRGAALCESEAGTTAATSEAREGLDDGSRSVFQNGAATVHARSSLDDRAPPASSRVLQISLTLCTK